MPKKVSRTVKTLGAMTGGAIEACALQPLGAHRLRTAHSLRKRASERTPADLLPAARVERQPHSARACARAHDPEPRVVQI